MAAQPVSDGKSVFSCLFFFSVHSADGGIDFILKSFKGPVLCRKVQSKSVNPHMQINFVMQFPSAHPEKTFWNHLSKIYTSQTIVRKVFIIYIVPFIRCRSAL